MTLLLVSPPVLYAPTWWSSKVASKPHLYSLAGFVRDLTDTRIVELDVKMGAPQGDVSAFLDDVEKHLDLDGVDLVGISCWTSLHYLGAVALAQKIRALRPELPIAVGGHHPTAVPDDFYDGNFDFVVRGDGEHVLRKLCETRPARPARTELLFGQAYQMTDPSRIDWEHYPWHDPEQRIVWLCLSRGCPFKCTYCAEPQRGTAWSHYSPEDAVAILAGLWRTHQPRIVCFADPLFGANRRWLEAFLDGLEKLALPTMFWCETRVDLMTPQLLERLQGCHFKVDFGLDTGSVGMAERMIKSPAPSTYLRKAREILRHANRIELFHDTYLLFNFPSETPETSRESMAFVEELVEGAASGWVSSQSFFILPGTESYQRMERDRATYGTEIRHPTWWREKQDHNALATDVLPSREWLGREDELRDWKKWQDHINAGRARNYSQKTMSFMKAFYGI